MNLKEYLRQKWKKKRRKKWGVWRWPLVFLLRRRIQSQWLQRLVFELVSADETPHHRRSVVVHRSRWGQVLLRKNSFVWVFLWSLGASKVWLTNVEEEFMLVLQCFIIIEKPLHWFGDLQAACVTYLVFTGFFFFFLFFFCSLMFLVFVLVLEYCVAILMLFGLLPFTRKVCSVFWQNRKV